MAHRGAVLVGLLFLLAVGACRSPSRIYGRRTVCPPAPAGGFAVAERKADDLAGTTWVGTAWRGSTFRIEFRAGGRLTWTARGPTLVDGTWDDGVWRLEGGRIVIEVTDGYATYTGTREGDRIHGTIRNVAGDQDTWEVVREE